MLGIYACICAVYILIKYIFITAVQTASENSEKHHKRYQIKEYTFLESVCSHEKQNTLVKFKYKPSGKVKQ